MPNAPVLIAAVDGPDQQHLACTKVFTWDRSYTIPSSSDPKFPAFLRHVGLTKAPDRWVDISARPDIGVGEPFPFQAKKVE